MFQSQREFFCRISPLLFASFNILLITLTDIFNVGLLLEICFQSFFLCGVAALTQVTGFFHHNQHPDCSLVRGVGYATVQMHIEL